VNSNALYQPPGKYQIKGKHEGVKATQKEGYAENIPIKSNAAHATFRQPTAVCKVFGKAQKDLITLADNA